MTVPTLHLAVNHLIFLTKDERYAIHAGETVETIGVTVPVWFWLGNTTEPAKELFCKYRITNEPTTNTIKNIDGGYEVNTPQPSKMEQLPAKIREVTGIKEIDTAKKLLDLKDGGSEWLNYKVFSKMKAVGVDKPIKVVHTIEMKPIEDLLTTLSS